MRVLWITNDLPPRAGGIEQFVGNLLLRGPVQETLVIGPGNPDAAAHDQALPYEVVRLPGRVLPRGATRRHIAQLAARHQPDVVVLGASWPLGELAPWLKREVAPVVALSHGHEAGLVSAKLGMLVRRATRGLCALTTISEYTEDLLRPHARADRLVRIPPGVDVEVFHPALNGAPLRRAWGVPDDVVLVGCLSRLVERKGQDALVRVWPRVQQRFPNAWLAIVGVGPLEQKLRATVAGLGAGANIVMPGRVDWQDLPAAHAAFDVFAMPCRTRNRGLDVEGLGIVYLEAQAVGVPAIAGRSGGAPETVIDGVTGLVVDATHDDALVDAIVTLLGDPERRALMGTAGRAHAVADWSWDIIAAKFNALLAEVAADGG
ncbi:MAG: phosphatidylinositol alpha-1,6-mannosyltransferase [Glaciecola sp.]